MTIDVAFKRIEKEYNLQLPYQIGHLVRFIYKGKETLITCKDEAEAQKYLAQIKMGYVQRSIFD